MTGILLLGAAPTVPTTPTGRVVLNLNEPNYYNKLYPWLDIWKNSEGGIQFAASGTNIYRTDAPPGGFSFGVASSYGVCTDNNGECVDMSVTAPTITSFSKTINQNDGGFLPPQLSGVSFTLMWTGGIGWTGSVNGNLSGAAGSKTATAASTSLVFTMPVSGSISTLYFVAFSKNTGSLASPPTNIHLVPTAQVTAFLAGEIFNSDYLDLIRATGGLLRTMPLMSTNSNLITTSIDSIPTEACWDWSIGAAGINRGCPLSILSKIALRTNKHLWFNVAAGFISAKISNFGNGNTNPFNPALGAVTSANPAIYQPNANQPFVNGDVVTPFGFNVNNMGAFGRAVKCTGLSSSVFSLPGHNFVNGQVVRPGVSIFAAGDSSTYPTGFSKGTFYYVCNAVAGVSFQIAAISAPSTPLTLTGTMKGPVNKFGAITGGSSYTNGTYTNVPMTGGTAGASGCTATVIVSGGAVTSVIPNYTISANLITGSGNGYVIGDSLSALAANIGGTGSGFSVLVGCVDINVMQQLGWQNFTVASATAQSFALSGPGSDTSFYGGGCPGTTINIGASTFTSSFSIGNGETIMVGTLDGVFADQSTYPTGLTKGQLYYVVNYSGGTFQLSTTFQGSPIALSGSMVGTPNFYKVCNATSATAQAAYSTSYFQTQLDRAASYFKGQFAGTKIITYWEYSNETWNPAGGFQTIPMFQGQSLGIVNQVGQNDIAVGYAMAAMADQLYTSYGGDKTKYRMLLGNCQMGNESRLTNAIVGINLYLTASGTSRTIAQLFDYVLVTNYHGSRSRQGNSSSTAATFAIGTPGTVALSGGAPGRPYKFHATAGALPTGLSENTTYWLSGAASPFNITATPGGSNIALSGTLGTYTAYECSTDVIGELMYQSMLLGPGPIGNATNPTQYTYFNQSMREDANTGKWTGLQGPAVFNNAFGITWLTSILAQLQANFLAVGKSLNGIMGILPYEGGDDNSMGNNFFATNQASGAMTASISGVTMTVSSISSVPGGSGAQIGMDVTGPGVTAGTIITGVRADLGPTSFTVNNSQTSSPTGWNSTTTQAWYVQNMYSDAYAQVFVDQYTANGAALSGYISQFLDFNAIDYNFGSGTFGMCQYIGDNNPRLTWVQYVNNLP